MKVCTLLGAPIGTGAGHTGCQLGPDTLRVAGLPKALKKLGYQVDDYGNVQLNEVGKIPHPFRAKNLETAVAWTQALHKAAYDVAQTGSFPIFLGGDHSVAFGTIPGVAQYAQEQKRPLFVLWIDAHTDFHALETSQSGNIHGMPVAYITGDKSFDGYFPPLQAELPKDNLCMIGMRSVDPEERQRLRDAGVSQVFDMRAVDEQGIIKILTPFLEKVRAVNGMLHVSLDVDGIDPEIAPAVGTTVPGGLTFRESHLMMEILHDSQLVTSLDLVELNPLLDKKAKTAKLLIDLTASLLGRKVLG